MNTPLEKECLIIFTRYPEPGKTKTRLIPVLGSEAAAHLQRQMTENTLMQARRLQTYYPTGLQVHFTGGNQELMQNWLGSDVVYYPQTQGNLGQRMASAFNQSFATGITSTVMIGVDCPDLDDQILNQAFQLLKQYDLVLGPAADGGYYLIGLNQFIPELFIGIDWGTSQVRQQTVEIGKTLNLSIGNLPLLYDIDRPEDLMNYQLSV